MTYIKTISEDIAGIGFSYPMAERYEQRLSQALRTAENRFYNGLEQKNNNQSLFLSHFKSSGCSS